jgi:putative ABC transport system permease protein
MKYLSFIWMNVWRRKIRTTFTLLCIFIAFLLFGYVMAIRAAFSLGVDVAGLDRLVLINKVTLILPLPISYMQKIKQTPGVEAVTHNTWFNGAYQQPTNVITSIAVEPETFLEIYPEFKLGPGQAEAWFADRRGAIIGRDLAERYGWKIGDPIPLLSSIYQPKNPWQFNIVGIYDAESGVDKTQFFFRYDYLDENQDINAEGNIGWYVVKISDPSRAVELSRTFDEMFANSGAETKTTTEKGFIEGFAKQIGDIGAITVAIASTVLIMFGLVAASTMVQSVRERTNELAVLKTLGFPDGRILALVLSESLFLTLVGGGLGLGVAWLLITVGGDPTGNLLPIFSLPPTDAAVGVGLMVLMGVVAGIAPAMSAMRLRITEALRKT